MNFAAITHWLTSVQSCDTDREPLHCGSKQGSSSIDWANEIKWWLWCRTSRESETDLADLVLGSAILNKRSLSCLSTVARGPVARCPGGLSSSDDWTVEAILFSLRERPVCAQLEPGDRITSHQLLTIVSRKSRTDQVPFPISVSALNSKDHEGTCPRYIV